MGRAGQELVCHFVGQGEKPEKSALFSLPPGPADAAHMTANETVLERFLGHSLLSQLPPSHFGSRSLDIIERLLQIITNSGANVP